MIIVNRLNDIITGSINNEPFGLSYSEEVYKKMKELETKANEVSTFNELNKLIEEFKPLTVEDLNKKIESFCSFIYVNKATGEYFLKNNGVISSISMPTELVDRIKTSMEKGIDFTPLVKCWIRWLRNPKLRKVRKENQLSFSQRFFNFINIKVTNDQLVETLMTEKGYSKEVAEELATTYSMKITNEGLLAGFKISTELTKRYKLNEKGEKEEYDVYEGEKSIDEITGLITYKKNDLKNEERVFEPAVMGKGGDAFMCSISGQLGHIIKVGATHSITWDQINCNDEQSCVMGLHIGGIDYIRGYQHSDTCTHNVFVCPSKIGAIPDDSTGAIRCIEYFVKDEFNGTNGSIYHSSKYGSKVDEQWNEDREEIIKHFGSLQEERKNEVEKESNELNAI